MTNRISISSIFIALCVITPTTLACWRIIKEPGHNWMELGPCGGNCFVYLSCPAGTVCDSLYILGGADNCTNGTRTVRSIQVTNAPTSVGACCLGGTPGGFDPAGSMCTQPWATFPTPFNPCLIGLPE